MSDSNFCKLSGVETKGSNRTVSKWFEILASSWFSIKNRTEEMVRGRATEDSAIYAIHKCSTVRYCFSCSMFGKIGEDFVAC